MKAYLILMLLTILCWFTALITWLINRLNGKSRAHSGEDEGKLAQSASTFGGKK